MESKSGSTIPSPDRPQDSTVVRIGLGLTLTTLATAGAYLVIYAYDAGLATVFHVDFAYISIGNEQLAALAGAIVASVALNLFALPILAIFYIRIGLALAIKCPRFRVVVSRTVISMLVCFFVSDVAFKVLTNANTVALFVIVVLELGGLCIVAPKWWSINKKVFGKSWSSESPVFLASSHSTQRSKLRKV